MDNIGLCDVVIGLTASLGAHIGSLILRQRLESANLDFSELAAPDVPQVMDLEKVHAEAYELEAKPFCGGMGP